MLKTLASSLFYARFARSFSVLGFHKAQASWAPDPIDLSGQRWLVTGASAGIGRAIALLANDAGADVLVVARNPVALAALKNQAVEPSRLQTLAVDLASMAAIKTMTEALSAQGQPVDVLVNNVGVLLDRYTLTDEGFETALATNLLGPVLLTESMVAGGVLPVSGAVIFVSSGGMYGTPLVLGDMIQPSAADYDGVRAYAMHKRAQVTFSHRWNREHPRGPVCYVMHPGWVDTPGVQTSLPAFRALFRRILRTPEQGADTVLWLGSERPAAPAEGIWLDRSNQPEHAFAFTQTSSVTPQDLDRYLHRVLEPWR